MIPVQPAAGDAVPAPDSHRNTPAQPEASPARLFAGPAPYVVRTPWRPLAGGAAALGVFAASTMAVVIAVIGIWLLDGRDFAALGNDPLVQLGATLIQQAVMIALTLYLAALYGGTMTGVLALGRPAQGPHVYIVAFFLFLAAMVVMSLISNALAPNANEADVAVFKGMFTSPLWPLALFVVGVGAPIAEELLFRGFLFSALANSRLGLVGSAVLTSLIFAIVHPYSLAGRVEVFAIGLLLSWLLVRTGSLRVTMFAHSLNNTIQALLMLAGADSWL